MSDSDLFMGISRMGIFQIAFLPKRLWTRCRPAAAIVLLMIAGCTVGPDFKRPATTMPAGWVGPTTAPTTRQSSVVEAPADLEKWWSVFNDPALDSLIDRAVASNLDLRQAELRVRQARASRQVVAASWYPFADASGSYRRSGTSDTSVSLYQMGLDASWEIDVFGGTRRSVEAAEADVRFNVEDQRDVLVTLISEVALAYFDLRGFQREIEIAKENLAAQRRSSEITRRLNAVGLVGGLDIANADAAVATTESAIPSLEQSSRQTMYTLAVLLGQHPAALVNELSLIREIPKGPNRVPIGLPSELLRRRPDIRRAEADLHAATARVGVAVSDLFPRFSITGSIGTASSKFGGLFNSNNGIWSIGPSLSWPIYQGGRIRANIDVQKLGADQSLVNWERTILFALLDVENALIAYEKEQTRREFLALAVDANRRAVQYATTLYSNGETDFIDVLNAQRSLLATEDALVRSDRNIAANLVAVYKALGGGWDVPDDEAPKTE